MLPRRRNLTANGGVGSGTIPHPPPPRRKERHIVNEGIRKLAESLIAFNAPKLPLKTVMLNLLWQTGRKSISSEELLYIADVLEPYGIVITVKKRG